MAPIQPTTSLLVLVSRLFWMMLGPVLLAVMACNIVISGNGWFTPTDFAFLALLGLLLLARWLEFRAGNPLTSLGEPATPGDLRRYVVVAMPLGLGAWVVANLIGNHLLTG